VLLAAIRTRRLLADPVGDTARHSQIPVDEGTCERTLPARAIETLACRVRDESDDGTVAGALPGYSIETTYRKRSRFGFPRNRKLLDTVSLLTGLGIGNPSEDLDMLTPERDLAE